VEIRSFEHLATLSSLPYLPRWFSLPTRLLAISGRVRRFSDAGSQVRGGEDPAGWLFLGPVEATGAARQPKLGPVEATRAAHQPRRAPRAGGGHQAARQPRPGTSARWRPPGQPISHGGHLGSLVRQAKLGPVEVTRAARQPRRALGPLAVTKSRQHMRREEVGRSGAAEVRQPSPPRSVLDPVNR